MLQKLSFSLNYRSYFYSFARKLNPLKSLKDNIIPGSPQEAKECTLGNKVVLAVNNLISAA